MRIADITAAPWINTLTNKTMVDAVYDNNYAGKETIAGYASQATVSICDFYNAKYNNLGNSWFECRVTKARLDKQIAKANEILANKALYTADSVKAIEDAMEVVKGISEERLNAKFADYGEEYYTLYDAVRYAKTAENAVADKAAADAVTALIDALPAAADTTLENADAVAAARAAFDKLTEAQQSLVSADATAKLKDCEAKIADLEAAEADKAAAAKVEETINALPAADKITLENKEAIEAARAAYDALTEAQQGLISEETTAALKAAEDALAKLEAAEADKAAAAKVTEAINALPAADKITLENKEAVVAARAAYDALTEAQQALVSKEAQDKLTACEARIAELEKPDEPVELPFTDLTQDWYMDSIRYVYEHELMYGTTDTTFAPDDALTRGMFVTMLYRMEGKPEVTGSASFTDVAENAYYADAVAWASANGVVYGTSETAFSAGGQDHPGADGRDDAPLRKLQEDRRHCDDGPVRLRRCRCHQQLGHRQTCSGPLRPSCCTATPGTSCSRRPTRRAPRQLRSSSGSRRRSSSKPRRKAGERESLPLGGGKPQERGRIPRGVETHIKLIVSSSSLFPFYRVRAQTRTHPPSVPGAGGGSSMPGR